MIARTHSHSQRAFTLLEVLLAVSLVVGLLAAAFGFYHQTAQIRHHVGAEIELARTVRVVMDRMTSELRSVIKSPVQAGLVMTDTEIQFTTVTLPGMSVWAKAADTEETIPPESDVQLVQYSVYLHETDDGETENWGLRRIAMKLLTVNASTDEGQADIEDDLLAPALKFVRFRYHTGQAPGGAAPGIGAGVSDEGWVEQWTTPDKVPLAVEITLGTHEKDELMDVEDYLESNPTFRRVVYLPATTIPRMTPPP